MTCHRFIVAALVLAFAQAALGANREIVAYVFPQNAVMTAGQIDPHSITRVNYAFAKIQDGRIVTGFAHDDANFAFLAGLRKENPSLRVLVSVGGWEWSGGFSDAALSEESRGRFIDSVVEFLGRYDLDGLDVDWEFPGLPGAGHTYRAEDKQNFTALLHELRTRFDKEGRKRGRKLYVTIAAGSTEDFLAHTEMGKVARWVDTVNVMAYDYYVPGADSRTGHNAALYTNPDDPEKLSADASVRSLERAGVPAGKMVLGVPFYGRAWADVGETAHGLYQPGKAAAGADETFTNIEAQIAGQGFTRYWDSVARVPWLYNAQTRTFISYDDEQSMAEKCRYVKANKVAGVMFWDLEADGSGKLLKAIDGELR